MRSINFVVILCCMLTAIGCGKNIALKGRVVFSDDGSPLSSGMVLLDDGKNVSRGVVKKDGTFIMGTMKERDGVLPGEYKVSIVGAYALLPCPQNDDDNPDNDIYPPPQKPLIDKRYENFETSGLTVHVEKPEYSYEIKVDRPAK